MTRMSRSLPRTVGAVVAFLLGASAAHAQFSPPPQQQPPVGSGSPFGPPPGQFGTPPGQFGAPPGQYGAPAAPASPFGAPPQYGAPASPFGAPPGQPAPYAAPGGAPPADPFSALRPPPGGAPGMPGVAPPGPGPFGAPPSSPPGTAMPGSPFGPPGGAPPGGGPVQARLPPGVDARMLEQLSVQEKQDFGVRPPRDLHGGAMHAPTPTTLPGARVIDTLNLLALVSQQPPVKVVIIDALGGDAKLPNAIPAPFAGQSGTFQDRVQQQLGQLLRAATGGNTTTLVVVYCLDPNCWLSYNAGLRALKLGYQNVFWYRGGIWAWQQAGLPVDQGQQQQQPPQQQQRQPQQQRRQQ